MRRALNLSSLPQFVRFCIVGAIGFCVDATVLYGAIYLLTIGPYFGRLLSYFAAATATWYLNRTLTFPDSRGGHKGKEWVKFVACNSLGGGVNYGAYVICLRYFGPSATAPVIGVGIGACAGLLVNYVLSRRLVFTGTRATATQTQ